MKYFLWIWTVLFFGVVGSIWIHGALIVYKNAHPSGVSAFDGVKVCQQIASQATNSGWNYTNCLKEMQKALAPTAVSYQT